MCENGTQNLMRSKTIPTPPSSLLIVDDDELVRKFLERVLKEAGYQTATASDGPEALQVAVNLEPNRIWRDEAVVETREIVLAIGTDERVRPLRA